MSNLFPLRAKILFVVLIFLFLSGLSFFSYSIFTTKNYKSMRLESISNMVDFKTEKVNKTITEIERVAITLVSGANISFQAKNKKMAEEFVKDIFRGFPTAIGGGFWYAPFGFNKNTYREGVYVFFDKELSDVIADNSLFLPFYDYHNSSWFQELSANLIKPYQVAWTSPYIDHSGSLALMTTAGAGLFDENGFLLAISTVDWEIQGVIFELSAIKPTVNSFVLLTAPENDYVISNTLPGVATWSTLSDIPWDLNAKTFIFNNITYFSFQNKLKNGWLLSVQIPKDEIFAEVELRNNKYSFIIAITSIIMLGLAFLLITFLVNNPIKRLMFGVNRLSTGDLNVNIDVKSADEMGLLAKTFNSMTFQLRELIEKISLESAEKERISTELSIASSIQSSMLPCIFPPFPERDEFDMYASMVTAKEVGGDFYDFYLVNENTLAIIIADVSGKGIPAALFMVITKTLIKNNAQADKNPKEVFDTVNAILCENNEAEMFVTAFLGYLNLSTGKFSYVNAGHNTPLLKRKGRFDWLTSKPNLFLAGMDNTIYNLYEMDLNLDDEIFLYTDGVTEATNHELMMFTENRLINLINGLSEYTVKEFCETVKSEIDKFSEGTEQADDITMLFLRFCSKKN